MELTNLDVGISTYGLMRTIQTRCPQLRKLCLNEILRVDPEDAREGNALRGFFDACLDDCNNPAPLNLGHFELFSHEGGLSLISDSLLLLLCATCPNLKMLNLTGCAGITPQGIAAVGTRFEKLLSLELENCSSLLDDDIRQIVDNFLSLQYLDICGSSALTDESLFAIAEHAALKEVRLDNRLEFSQHALDHVWKRGIFLHLVPIIPEVW